jgi:hypothetical protein
MQAIRAFSAQPPRVQDGLRALGTNLLEAVRAPVEEAYRDPASFQQFEQAWMNFFDTALTKSPSIQGNITVFQEDGNPDAVILAVSDILNLLGEGVVEFVPMRTAQEVIKYVDAVADVLGALGTSWAGFENGQEAQAIEDLYAGLRAALDNVLPANLKNDETYKLIIGTLDGVIFNLSETVLEFQRQIVESRVCWKTQRSRDRTRPSVCPPGFYWNGETLCLPETTAAPAPASLIREEASEVSILDHATFRKGNKPDKSTSGKNRVPDGARVAICDANSEHPEKVGGWCFAACPLGMVSTGSQCKTECSAPGSQYPADDGAALCGQNQGVITEAIVNIVLGVTNGAISSALLIAGLVRDGVDSNSLTQTINSFVNLAKPFAYKQCPLPGAIPAGPPAVTGPR